MIQEYEKELRQFYADCEAEEKADEAALNSAIAPFDKGGKLSAAVAEFRDEMMFTKFLGIVSAEDVKGDRQESDYPFEHEFVNQTTNGGHSGDDFAGTIYFPLSDSQYLAFSYSC